MERVSKTIQLPRLRAAAVATDSLRIPATATGQVERLWALMQSDPEKQQGCEATARRAPLKLESATTHRT